jgi:hypothetical protein
MKRFIYQGLDLGEEEVRNALEIVDHDKVTLHYKTYI